MPEKVHLQLETDSLYIVCKTEKVRDRILERLQEYRLEWARVLGPLRFKLRESFWTDRHFANSVWALLLDLIAVGMAALLLNEIQHGEDYWGSIFLLAFFTIVILWPNFEVIRSVWTLHQCRLGAILLPNELELTDRKINGVLREETLTGPRVDDIDLEAIEKLWFLTERSLGSGGRVRKKIRWKYRFDPFGVVSQDECITGVRIRAAGRTYTLWADRFENDWAMRSLCKAIQQSVRERLFPKRAA